MFRKIRIALATLFFIGITLLFLDITGTAHRWLGWMAQVQLLPAILALNVIIVILLLLTTLLFGRIYCSVICPLGVMQDIISWINGKRAKKNRFRFRYSPAKNILRYTVLVLFIAGLTLGANQLVVLIAPYSAYGRIVSNLMSPLYEWGNNLFAWVAERADSYAFYSTEVWIRSTAGFVTAAVTLAITGFLAWKYGRAWCNTICPVGSFLSLISRFSIFAPVIDSEKCRSCGLCGRRCKSSCIDMQSHEIDYSRCVVCMDCIDTCKEGAIHYALRKRKSKVSAVSSNDESGKEAGVDRRTFITASTLIIASAAAKAQQVKVDGGLAEIERAEIPARNTPLVPAGSISLKNFDQHCVSCQLCVSNCPNNVLRPSADLETFMQPEMSFERGYCRPECTNCSEVCPAGAIRPVTIEEKTSIQIGHAVVNLDNCVVNTDGVSCGNCARHCPAGAIRMVRKDPDDKESLRIPAVNEEKCIGCGACENLCPARPFTAIHVEGHEVHRTI